jgi:hypothetical protein
MRDDATAPKRANASDSMSGVQWCGIAATHTLRLASPIQYYRIFAALFF